ncbi:hypothetical protein L7F22_021598 [Adiantum nelumboides]|nr:hypothetical protein [Adiantum nelumboides]
MRVSSALAAAPALHYLMLLLPFALIIHTAGQQRLSLSPQWTFSADLSFPSSSSHSSLNSYRGIAPFSLFAPILSSSAFVSGSKGFSFGFFSSFQTPSSSPSQISLAICLGVGAQQSSRTPFLVPVWTLNITTPLQQRGEALVKLQVDDNKQLSLVDGDGSVVWAWSNVDSMEMQSNGNLVMYDSRNGSIWQSFEHPSDMLLRGQRLRVGMEMTSSNKMYRAAMEAGGVVFYQVSANPLPLVYWGIPANKTVSGFFGNMMGAFALDKDSSVNVTASLLFPSCANFNSSLAYLELSEDHFLVQDACANVDITLYNITIDLLRLDSDGMVRDYSVSQLPNSSYAITSTKLDYQPCFSPNVCGVYGICSVSNTFGTAVRHSCRCPSEEDNESFSDAFSLIDISNPSEGCTRKVTLECEQTSSQTLVEIPHVAYMSMLPLFERTWEYNTKPLEDCTASCSSNCSCSGLIYHTKSSFCLPFGDTSPLSNVSFLSLPSDEHIAFVKMQLQQSIGNGRHTWILSQN